MPGDGLIHVGQGAEAAPALLLLPGQDLQLLLQGPVCPQGRHHQAARHNHKNQHRTGECKKAFFPLCHVHEAPPESTHLKSKLYTPLP